MQNNTYRVDVLQVYTSVEFIIEEKHQNKKLKKRFDDGKRVCFSENEKINDC